MTKWPSPPGCQWLDAPGTDMRVDGWREEATKRALRHQNEKLGAAAP